MRVDRQGFTLAEVIVAITLGAVVMAAAYQTIINSQRTSQSISQRIAVQQTLRMASHYLNLSFRELSSSEGDITNATANTIAFRGMRWSGFICRDAIQVSATEVQLDLEPTYVLGLRGPDAVQDSILLYREGQETLRMDDAWMYGAIRGVTAGTCSAGTPSTRLRVQLNAVAGGADSAATGVWGGAPIRGFQPEELSISSLSGRAWIGQRTANAAGTWTPVQPIIGPLAPNGMIFLYSDAAGGATTNRLNIQTVQFVVHAESPSPTRRGDGSIGYVTDSISTRVLVRNNARY